MTSTSRHQQYLRLKECDRLDRLVKNVESDMKQNLEDTDNVFSKRIQSPGLKTAHRLLREYVDLKIKLELLKLQAEREHKECAKYEAECEREQKREQKREQSLEQDSKINGAPNGTSNAYFVKSL